MKTNYSWLKYCLLSIITLGIYSIYFWTVYGINLNKLYPQGKPTMNFCLILFIFTVLTLGIAAIVWQHRVSAKIGKILEDRKINYTVSAADFWLWCILGSFIVVGPFVYLHKMCKGMNLAAQSYLGQPQ